MQEVRAIGSSALYRNNSIRSQEQQCTQHPRKKIIALVRNFHSFFSFFFSFLCISCYNVGYVHVLTPNLCLDGQQSPQSLQSSSCLLWTKITYKRHRWIHCSKSNRNKRGKKEKKPKCCPHRAWIAWIHLRRHGDHWSGRVKKYFDMAFLNLFLYWSGDMIVGRTSLEPPKKPDAFTQVSSCLSQVYCRR